MAEHRVGTCAQIPPGEGRSFIVGRTELAVFHTREGGYFATQALCPHRAGPLADGLTDSGTVVCPLHDRVFSLSTGSGIGNDLSIQTYPVRIDNEHIYVDLAGEA
jgi:nitrite reductase (NADH) small subunit